MIDHSKGSLSEALGIDSKEVLLFLANSQGKDGGQRPSQLIESLMNTDELTETQKMFGAFILGTAAKTRNEDEE